MTLQCGLHNITSANATTFKSDGEDVGCVSFHSKNGSIDLYMEPDAAKAIADAFNASLRSTTARLVYDAEREDAQAAQEGVS